MYRFSERCDQPAECIECECDGDQPGYLQRDEQRLCHRGCIRRYRSFQLHVEYNTGAICSNCFRACAGQLYGNRYRCKRLYGHFFGDHYTASAVTMSSAGIPATCNGSNNGQGIVIPAGGTPTYTYLWMPGAITSASASSLAPGTYTATATDANGCTITASETIPKPSP